MLLLKELSIFLNSGKIWKIEFFEYKPRRYFDIFSSSLKSLEIGVFEDFIFCPIVRIAIQAR